MSSDQYVTLAIALWGAVLSTILAIWEIRKSRKRILIRLEIVYFLDIVQITITNVGYRSITITGIEVRPEGHDAVPSNFLLSTRVDPTQPLPATISDGEHIVIPLSDVVSEILLKNGMKAEIAVHDAEGRTYRKYKTGRRNPKWVYFGNR